MNVYLFMKDNVEYPISLILYNDKNAKQNTKEND